MTRKLFTFIFATIFVALLTNPVVSATGTNGFQAGRIIDDAVFTNTNTMSVADIQNFLNSKVPTCDTNHAGFTGSTGTAYNPQFICLKNFYENPSSSYTVSFTYTDTNGNTQTGSRTYYSNNAYRYIALTPVYTNGDYKQGYTLKATIQSVNGVIPSGAISAAQIIYNTAQTYGINPQVLIVLLQKEQGLVTDTWPASYQYQSATGYGCPDYSPCSSSYSGFSNQLKWAATMFHAISTNSPSWYSPYILGNNSILYNPNVSCGSSVVNIQNRATQALYNYTPYQPNTAALTAGYGTGDSCSAYGNRNFYLYFNDWFGPSTSDSYFYRVIQGDASSEVYLQTPAGKYYVPSYTLLAEWGLGPSDVDTVPQSYVNNLPTKNQLSNSLTDGSGKLYVVEGGSIHQVTGPDYTSIWHVDVANMVTSLGLSMALPNGGPLGRMVTQRGGDGSIWLVDGTKRHLVSGAALYQWGYYPGAATTVSPYLFSSFSVDTNATSYASSDGGLSVWAIDANTKRPFKDTATSQAFTASSQVTLVNQSVLNLLTQGATLNRFIESASTKQWFMVDLGTKHYISQGDIATLWGISQNPLTYVSDQFLSTLSTSQVLGYTAQSNTDQRYWLIAGKRYYIANDSIYTSLTGTSSVPPVYSDTLLQTITNGGNLGFAITGDSSPYNYTYLLDSGSRRYVQGSAAAGAWIQNPVTVPSILLRLIPEKSFISSIVSDGTSIYYVESRRAYPVASGFQKSWNIQSTSTVPVVSNTTISSLATGAPLSDSFRDTNGTLWLVSGGTKHQVQTYADAYSNGFPTSNANISGSGLSTGADASYLLSSNDPNDGSIWLITGGQKILLTFEQQVSLGYLSRGINPIPVSPTLLSQIPTSSNTFSILIQKSGSGIKQLNFGTSLGFLDGQTLISYINASTGILTVSPSIFDSIPLTGNTSSIIYDDLGRYWLMQDGVKRYITSWAAFTRNGYTQVPPRYQYGITMGLIPTGNPIN